MSTIAFSKLKPGERFEADGEAWKKLELDLYEGMPLTEVDNAQTLGRRQTKHFAATDLVARLSVPSLSFWRRWLLTRSLRWQVAGFTWWAKWSWRLARVFAREKTDQAMAAHVAQLLMMGE